MKFIATISLLAMVLLGSTATALAQGKSCSFDLEGTWKAQLSPTEAILYRFDSKGAVTVLSAPEKSEPHEIAVAKYEVINDLGKVYSLGYKPTNSERDDSWRWVQVSLPNHPDLIARTRPGYYAQ